MFERILSAFTAPSALSTSNLHSHKCPAEGCGTVWRHDPDTIPEDDGAHDRAHQCPRCGTEQIWIYKHQGALNPTAPDADFCHNGARTINLNSPKADAEQA